MDKTSNHDQQAVRQSPTKRWLKRIWKVIWFVVRIVVWLDRLGHLFGGEDG